MELAGGSVVLSFTGDIAEYEADYMYTILKRNFKVKLEQTSELSVGEDSDNIITHIGFSFDSPFRLEFFRELGGRHWMLLKESIKEIKKRRGNFGISFTFDFEGDGTQTTFDCQSCDNDTISGAIEKLEYMAELVEARVALDGLPYDISSLKYMYNQELDRWRPSQAKMGDQLYVFSEETRKWSTFRRDIEV